MINISPRSSTFIWLISETTWSRILSIALILASYSSIHCQGTSNTCNSKERKSIDDFIYKLNYTNDGALAYSGADSKTSMPSREGKLTDNGDFIVISRTHKSLNNEKADIGVIASNEHQTYPGVLLLANQRLIDNQPDVLAVDRANLTYTINLPGLTEEDEGFTIVPSFNEFQSSTNKLLNLWFEKYSKDHEVNANFESDHSFAYSQDLLRVKFGVEFKNTVIESNIDFDAVKTQKKLIMVYKFKQIFYTISVQPTNHPSDLFGCDVTLNDLQNKVNEKNPPVLVDSVSYGRTIYVKLETSSTDDKAKVLLENKLSKFFIDNKNEGKYDKQLKNVDIQVFVIGGGSDQISLINAKTLKEVNKVIVDDGKFTKSNLGFPVSYSAQFIKDNSRAVVNMATSYTETTRTVHKKGVVKLIHHGLYLAKFILTWKEITYDKDGNKIEKDGKWKRNGQVLTAPFEEEIELPGNTGNIHVICKYVTGVPWQWWRTLINQSGIELIDRREFKVAGTTLMPEHSITPPADTPDDSAKHQAKSKTPGSSLFSKLKK